jgi:hypothetical protein
VICDILPKHPTKKSSKMAFAAFGSGDMFGRYLCLVILPSLLIGPFKL